MSAVYRRSSEPRTDWFRVLADLNRLGMSNRGIARRLRIPYSTICSWKSTVLQVEPGHSAGEALISLWCDEMHRDRSALPFRDPYSPI